MPRELSVKLRRAAALIATARARSTSEAERYAAVSAAAELLLEIEQDFDTLADS